MTYKACLSSAMTELGRNPRVLFVGYGLSFDAAAAGTFKGVDKEQRIEMPLAENLMMSAAIGLAIEGYIPVVFFERFDFILNAADAIVNHLDKLNELSDGEFGPCLIIRAVVGNRLKPLLTGATHTQDFSDAFRSMTSIQMVKLLDKKYINEEYAHAMSVASTGTASSMLIEYKDKYDEA